MRLFLRKKGIRKDFRNHPKAKGIILEKDLKIGFSKLRAKLLVFDKASNLRRFWSGPLGKGDLGRYCKGAVNGLSTEFTSFRKGKKEEAWIEADPRYYCVIGLVSGHLYGEIICHESVHAAFNYAKRIRKSPWDECSRDFDEEEICYPAGRIAAEISNLIHRHKLA